MANHIELTGSESRLAGKFRDLVDRTQNLQDDMRRVKYIMDESGASGTPDWTAVRVAFGFANDAAAQAAYILLSAAAQKINSADVDNFCNRIG
jgi:hypothetical protein